MPDRTPITDLAGVPLDAAATVAWGFYPGVRPHIARVQARKAAITRILGTTQGTEPVRLSLRHDAGKAQVWERLYVLGEVPADAPWLGAVELADERWLWARRHILRRYNLRRETGETAILSGSFAGGIEAGEAIPDIDYRPVSLHNGTPWTPVDVLRDVLDAVTAGRFRVDGTFVTQAVEDLEIDDAGDAAVAKALALVPDAELYLDEAGRAIVYNRHTGGEVAALNALGPDQVGGAGRVEYVSHHRTRPSAIRVLFTRAVEVRFDFGEDETRTRVEEDRKIHNVLPVPDPSLLVMSADAATSARRVNAGTFIDVNDAFTSWDDPPGGLPPLSRTIVNRDWWAGLLLMSYGKIGEGDRANSDWVARIGAVYAHYRQTFQIARRWVDRALAIEPERPFVVQQETGARVPALVYADHAVELGFRGLSRDPGNATTIRNQTGFYPTGGGGGGTTINPLANGRPAPARVQMLLPTAGIFRLAWQVDVLRLREKIHPCPFAQEASANPADAGLRPVRHDEISLTLAATHRVAVLLTLVPAFPNDERQLHAVKVPAADVAPLLAGGLAAGRIQPANGPTLDVRVPASLVRAITAWDDGRAAEIEGVFGLGDASAKDLPIANHLAVDAVARAVATATYSAFLDGLEGAKIGPLTPEVHPLGRIAEVETVLDPSGHVATTARLPRPSRPLNFLALLPDGIRRILLRQVKV